MDLNRKGNWGIVPLIGFHLWIANECSQVRRCPGNEVLRTEGYSPTRCHSMSAQQRWLPVTVSRGRSVEALDGCIQRLQDTVIRHSFELPPAKQRRKVECGVGDSPTKASLLHSSMEGEVNHGTCGLTTGGIVKLVNLRCFGAQAH